MNIQKRLACWICLGVFLALSAAVFGCHTASPGEGSGLADFNLLLITLDTVRADRIGAYGYKKARTPNLDFLAENGVLFENCYASVPITLPSHSSIFTGRYPTAHGVRNNGSYSLGESETTLAEAMEEAGFQTGAVIASFVLMSKFGLDQGFEHYDDSLNVGEMINNLDTEISADQIFSRFSRWLGTRDRKKKFFAWLHFYDPHAPYSPPKEYRAPFPETSEGAYDGEISFVDFYVGKVMNRLASEDLTSTTLVVVTGDHGEAFGEHDEFGHALFCYEENLKVPLIFHGPELASNGRRITNRVRLIDIMPTILDMFAAPIPEQVQGISFAGLLWGRDEMDSRPLYFESLNGQEEMGWAQLTGLIDGPYKFISLPEPELYDLRNDSGERTNLIPARKGLARELERKLGYLVASTTLSIDSRREPSDSDRRRLEALGYVTSFSAKASAEIDPKRGIVLKSRLNGLERMIESGNLAEAETRLESFAEESPEFILPKYFGLRDRIYRERGESERIITNWEQAAKRFPENEHFKVNLAFELFHLGRWEDSERVALLVLDNDAGSTRATILMAKIAELRGDLEEAIQYFDRALKLEPENVSLKIAYVQALAKNRNFDEAAELCNELLRDEFLVAHPDLASRIGAVLAEVGKDELAHRVLSEISEEDRDAEAWNTLGIVRYRNGDFENAIAAYAKSIDLDPARAVTLNNLGTLHLTLATRGKEVDHYREAVKAFDRALAIDPRLPSALNGRGSAQRLANKVQEALEDWKQALAVKPDFTDVYFNIGVTYLRLNRNQEALRYLALCKKRYSDLLSPSDRKRLDRLILEATPSGL